MNKFNLIIKCKVNPYKNTSLEGLYSSGKILTTQCEAEGFRRICYHPDRPDVLSKYRVRIEADINRYPVLLSNGNQVKRSKCIHNPSRHDVVWEDPFPKPSYLFALVAGDLEQVEDSYKTKSGSDVKLRLFVESGDEVYTNHALQSLKKAMNWDEEVYGLEYDLNEYNIVAIRHFNMGAMENKSLNIFNSKLVLADDSIATDSELERIESVVAHEYFHNWTGNRITCRDWFQLSLKEGLTVFRDQSFTSDIHSSALKRIDDVSKLRSVQFREDSGPTAHAVKPDKYLSIDNFYTTTIYEKGAELVRMLYTLIGHENFMLGFKMYVEQFDGKAATTEDFLSSIYEGSRLRSDETSFDIEQFSCWYYQAGTPEVSITRDWNASEGILSIEFEQSTKSTNSQQEKLPMVIPIKYALISKNGKLGEEKLFILKDYSSQLLIENLPAGKNPPSLSILRNFSAPINLKSDFSDEEYIDLFMFDDDPFSRWEAGQTLIRKVIISSATGVTLFNLENELILVFRHLIETLGNVDPSLLSSLIRIPCISELECYQEQFDPISLYKARMEFIKNIGIKLAKPLKHLLDKNRPLLDLEWPLGQGQRQIVSLVWFFMAAAGDMDVLREALDAVSGHSMTMSKAALFALKPIDSVERKMGMRIFYDRWKKFPLILDSWFGLEASIPRAQGLIRIQELLDHPSFDIKAPNSVRSLLGGLSQNQLVFHAVDGSGYSFMADKLLQIDRLNPITASRLVKTFSGWKKYVSPQKEQMYKALTKIAQSELSKNTREVIELIISV